MPNIETVSIVEANRLRLAEYLQARVLDGLAGRDGQDLVAIEPTRAVFAGVLAPIDDHSSGANATGGATGSGTSLGLDMRLKVPDARSSVRLRVSPRWSFYYAVFPTFKQAKATGATSAAAAENGEDQEEESDVPDDSGSEPPETLALGGMAAIDAGSDVLGGDQPLPQDAALSASTPTGEVILPRVWRRHDVEIEPFEVVLPAGRSSQIIAGQDEIGRGIAVASAAVLAEPRGWRHLGPIKDRARKLGDERVVASEGAYNAALASVKGPRVEPPPWAATVRVEAMLDVSAPDVLRVRVILSNATPRMVMFGPDSQTDDLDPLLEERSLLDAALGIEVEQAHLEPFQFLLAPRDYRTNPQLPAKGMNCVAEVTANSDGIAVVRSSTLPTYRQPLYRTRDDLQVPFESLDVHDPTEALRPIKDAMEQYLCEWDAFLNAPPARFGPAEIAACHADRNEFAAEIERLALGIEALQSDQRLKKAFRYMNRVFADLARRSGGRLRAWRLFQVGFIVSQMPALAVRELPDSAADDYANSLREALGEVGILWFPTGGGKTEAYLGLIATALLYDRLRGKERGVCAWMRFPLRMLSLQQLERLARMIASLNMLRATEGDLLSGDPFAIGYFVGDTSVPNSIDARAMKRYEERDDLRERVRLLRTCPFCNSRVSIQPDRTTWRLKHVCENSACFSNTAKSLGVFRGSLPICVVDTEIYRYLPSVMIGTVDKLAIAGRQRLFAHVVRGVTQRCPVHGYMSYDECSESWSAECKIKKSQIERLPLVRDPGISLLVQDELHLLRDELGVFDGHYEGLLQYLGRKAHLQPKVLAATATIEAYDVQAFHIYLSRARRYPQPAWEQGESFYATSQPPQQRRLYAGLLGHTRGIEEPALRAMALYQRELRRLRRDVRRAAQIMDATDASDEAIQDTLRLYDLCLAFVNRKAVAGSIEEKAPPQIERLLEPEGLGSVHAQRLTGDQTTDDVGAVLDRIERERQATEGSRLDVLAATNMISHGVDLERVNMMVVCGMPSHYAEYVQASSRAARQHPGLVFVCFKARDPREASQFEFFPVMHQHMDRLIEAVAVNRFASFAPDKTVPGLLAGVLLHDIGLDLWRRKATSRALDHVPTLRTALGMRPADSKSGALAAPLIDRDAVLTAIQEIVGVDRTRPPASPAQIENVRDRVEQVFEDNIAAINRAHENRLADVLNPLTSFRDVDEGLPFGSLFAADLVDRVRGR